MGAFNVVLCLTCIVDKTAQHALFFWVCTTLAQFAKLLSVCPNKDPAGPSYARDLPNSTLCSSCSGGHLYKFIWSEWVGPLPNHRETEDNGLAWHCRTRKLFTVFLKCRFLLQNSPIGSVYFGLFSTEIFLRCLSKTDVVCQLEKDLFNMLKICYS